MAPYEGHVLPSMQKAAADKIDGLFEELGTEFGCKLALKSVAHGGGSVGKNSKVLQLKGKNGAGNEVRTRDPQLGKLMLYQLSYSRIRGRFSAGPCVCQAWG